MALIMGIAKTAKASASLRLYGSVQKELTSTKSKPNTPVISRSIPV